MLRTGMASQTFFSVLSYFSYTKYKAHTIAISNPGNGKNMRWSFITSAKGITDVGISAARNHHIPNETGSSFLFLIPIIKTATTAAKKVKPNSTAGSRNDENAERSVSAVSCVGNKV